MLSRDYRIPKEFQMIYIAHRGNVDGPNSERENEPYYIQEAIALGYMVEVDVWFVDGKFLLGHDEPTYEVSQAFLARNKRHAFFHAKNIDALRFLIEMDMNCFSHENDPFIVTNHGDIWAFPGHEKLGCISVMPERSSFSMNHLKILGVKGVCSDFIRKYRDD